MAKWKIKFERLQQEAAYVEVEADSPSAAIEAAMNDLEDLDFEADTDPYSPYVYNIENESGETYELTDARDDGHLTTECPVTEVSLADVPGVAIDAAFQEIAISEAMATQLAGDPKTKLL